MNVSATRPPSHRIGRALGDAQVRVALLAAVALMVEAVLAKNVLDVHLDVISQFAAMWIFIAFQLTERRDHVAELAADIALIVATAAVLVVYAL